MPSVKVLIPTPLRKFTGEQETVTAEGDTVGALLQALISAHPGLGKPLLDENGQPRRFVNLYLNGEDVRFLQNTDTGLKEGDELSIVPAIAGGVGTAAPVTQPAGAVGSEVYNLTFHRDMFHKPILHSLGKRFRLTLNIRRAILNEEAGWAEVEFSGSLEEIGRAIAELHTTGVNITGPLTNLIEPDPDQAGYAPIGRGT